MTKECKSCQEEWYSSDIKDGLCPNCYDYFNQLKQQLAEKQNTIDEINKEFVQAVYDWKALCAKKDKEIEELKQQNIVLENENKLATTSIIDKYREAQKEVSFGIQLAIQELEKVKEFMNETYGYDCCADVSVVDNFIDHQIKELKGEWAVWNF